MVEPIITGSELSQLARQFHSVESDQFSTPPSTGKAKSGFVVNTVNQAPFTEEKWMRCDQYVDPFYPFYSISLC